MRKLSCLKQENKKRLVELNRSLNNTLTCSLTQLELLDKKTSWRWRFISPLKSLNPKTLFLFSFSSVHIIITQFENNSKTAFWFKNSFSLFSWPTSLSIIIDLSLICHWYFGANLYHSFLAPPLTIHFWRLPCPSRIWCAYIESWVPVTPPPLCR